MKAAGDVYVVKASFQVGNTPYAVGTVISSSTYNSLGDSDKGNNITKLTFTEQQKNLTFYYCRESYKVGENTEGVEVTNASVTGSATGTYNANTDNVPVGLVITKDKYDALANRQTDFTIHGIAPTETSTLYVSRSSDIFDLSKEKIITVIYEYNYEEANTSGTNITPVSERHVVNIHVLFKSGIPFVEDIKAPQIVLPGTFVGIREPHVTPGAYEVTGGGWKLFEKIGDAESHINGIEYTPTSDPLYWYQDGYYLAYYAKTYLGETYSNTVQVSVANYHDLTKVLDDTQHHYYVDNKNVKRNSKIYITDATNGATQLKQFFDLSKSTTLDDHVKNCQNLEFILRTNVDHTGSWSSIGDDDNCFEGNLHGDGYHIDGLDKSLFYNLCGNVYNLGVTGSFTSAGIADKDDATKDKAFMENCWINTSATSGFNSKAILGTPATSTRKKVVNCYYPQTKTYTASDAIPMPQSTFYNGTVGYNLNGFYLYKRYNNTKTGSGMAHTFYTINTDGTLSAPQTKNYVEQNATYCSSGIENIYLTKDGVVDYGGYVEDRYADGDYRYANGTIPESADEREYTDTDDKVHYYPIWPDDYIFFGQMLTYDWISQRPHEDVPSRIVKNSGRLSTSKESNRIYRAPAYYQSKTMEVAHFNPSVNLVAYSKPKNANDKDLLPAYPNMTAIDFAGHFDTDYVLGKAYRDGVNWKSTPNDKQQSFYPPLLDDDGIVEIFNHDETKNLLVYAPANDPENENAPASRTYWALTNYFTEPVFEESGVKTEYRCVAKASSDDVAGHLVQATLTNGKPTAAYDHLLVDEQDFNCPIAYNMGAHQMWYQRLPKNLPEEYEFVTMTDGKTKGWRDICLPFTAELVTTQDKGEITHFYQGSLTGHEYWLREYNGIDDMASTDDELAAIFNSPNAAGTGSKDYTNTYLWDNYYSMNYFDDKNSDDFQKTYYEAHDGKVNTYDGYPYLQAGTPYLIGFPGKTYYEFDLSGYFGKYDALNTIDDDAINKPNAQTISFVSAPNIDIAVSDDELAAGINLDNYVYHGTYTSKKLAEGDYLLNSDGDKYVKQAAGVVTQPFHTYFLMTNNSGTRTVEQPANKIYFKEDPAKLKGTTEIQNVFEDGDLLVKGGRKKIMVESQLHYTTDVRIVTPAGVTLTTYSIQPSEYIETRVQAAGVYIVYADNGKYVKKVIVR